MAESKADLLMVAPGPSATPGKVLLWEVHPDHPNEDQEVFIAAPGSMAADKKPPAVEVARTPAVMDRLKEGLLIEVRAPAVARLERGGKPDPAKAESPTDAEREGA